MCGIAGFFVPNSDVSDAPDRLVRMAEVLHHRGPDGSGIWNDQNAGIGLAHARLSVIDLSPGGSQPMHSASGRHSICFNGEIYNFPQIRAELESNGLRFRGHCDTEVLLEGIEYYGLREMVSRCIGMFAFAVWNHESRSLALVRDRLGIKPLYWSFSDEKLVFGSELKSLLASGFVRRDIDRGGLSQYLTFGYVPAPLSILQNVHKLNPGEILTATSKSGFLDVSLGRYWSSLDAALAGRARPFEGSEESMLDQIDEVIGSAVSDRMIADVPLGAFLSGGIDSSLIVAMMQERSAVPIKTFTIGFNEELFDESDAARAIAGHLGTDHTELVVTPEDSLNVIPTLPDLYDEPFADSSQIPTFLVSKLARTEVTVSLSGDGGDELFGGYNRYLASLQITNRLARVPAPFRNLISSGVQSMSPSGWDQLYKYARSMSFGRLRKRQFGRLIHKLAQALRVQDSQGFYQKMVSLWPDASQVYPAIPHGNRLDDQVFSQDLSLPEKMFLADTRSYLVDDILTKVDRASMGVSLEARVPFLDHRVYESAWRLPMSLRLDNGLTKIALRKLLNRRMPMHLYDGPKKGFGVPIIDWLRHDLRDWAESLLRPADLEGLGLNAKLIQTEWQNLLSRSRYSSAPIWCILMLRAWQERWIKN